MLVEPNYYLRPNCLFPQVSDLLGDPAHDSPDKFSALLDTYGRTEVLRFLFNDQAFVQTNRRQRTAVEPQVAGSYHFPWMNTVTPSRTPPSPTC